MSELSIRVAAPEDAPVIFELVQALASYERLTHEVASSAEDFRKLLTDGQTNVEILLADWSGETVGFALFFKNFSTFLGKPGLYLEDLFVRPEFRGRGVGTALLNRIIGIAKNRDYGRVDWTVLDWNESAIKFYTQKIGAKFLSSWRLCRVVIGE
jgi:GNAT superfamily N-acetyltransferase